MIIALFFVYFGKKRSKFTYDAIKIIKCICANDSCKGVNLFKGRSTRLDTNKDVKPHNKINKDA